MVRYRNSRDVRYGHPLNPFRAATDSFVRQIRSAKAASLHEANPPSTAPVPVSPTPQETRGPPPLPVDLGPDDVTAVDDAARASLVPPASSLSPAGPISPNSGLGLVMGLVGFSQPNRAATPSDPYVVRPPIPFTPPFSAEQPPVLDEPASPGVSLLRVDRVPGAPVIPGEGLPVRVVRDDEATDVRRRRPGSEPAAEPDTLVDDAATTGSLHPVSASNSGSIVVPSGSGSFAPASPPEVIDFEQPTLPAAPRSPSPAPPGVDVLHPPTGFVSPAPAPVSPAPVAPAPAPVARPAHKPVAATPITPEQMTTSAARNFLGFKLTKRASDGSLLSEPGYVVAESTSGRAVNFDLAVFASAVVASLDAHMRGQHRFTSNATDNVANNVLHRRYPSSGSLSEKLECVISILVNDGTTPVADGYASARSDIRTNITRLSPDQAKLKAALTQKAKELAAATVPIVESQHFRSNFLLNGAANEDSLDVIDFVRTHFTAPESKPFVDRFVAAVEAYEEAALAVNRVDRLSADAAAEAIPNSPAYTQLCAIIHDYNPIARTTPSSFDLKLRNSVFRQTNFGLAAEFMAKATGADYLVAFKMLESQTPNTGAVRSALDATYKQARAGVAQRFSILMHADFGETPADGGWRSGEEAKLATLATQNADCFTFDSNNDLSVNGKTVSIGKPLVMILPNGTKVPVVPVRVVKPKTDSKSAKVYSFVAYRYEDKWYRHAGTIGTMTPSAVYEGWATGIVGPTEHSLADAEFNSDISALLSASVRINAGFDKLHAYDVSAFGLDYAQNPRYALAIAMNNEAIVKNPDLAGVFNKPLLGVAAKTKRLAYRTRLDAAVSSFDSLLGDLEAPYAGGKVLTSSAAVHLPVRADSARSIMNIVARLAGVTDGSFPPSSAVAYVFAPMSESREVNRAQTLSRRYVAALKDGYVRGRPSLTGPYYSSTMDAMYVLANVAASVPTERFDSTLSELALAIVRRKTPERMIAEMSVSEKDLIAVVLATNKGESASGASSDVSAAQIQEFLDMPPAKREFLLSLVSAKRIRSGDASVPAATRYERARLAKERLYSLCALDEPSLAEKLAFLKSSEFASYKTGYQDVFLTGIANYAPSLNPVDAGFELIKANSSSVTAALTKVRYENNVSVAGAAASELELICLLEFMGYVPVERVGFSTTPRNSSADFDNSPFKDRSRLSLTIDALPVINLDLVVHASSGQPDSVFCAQTVGMIKSSFEMAATLGWVGSMNDVIGIVGLADRQLNELNAKLWRSDPVTVSIAVSFIQGGVLQTLTCGAGRVGVNESDVATKLSLYGMTGSEGGVFVYSNHLGMGSFNPSVNTFVRASDNALYASGVCPDVANKHVQLSMEFGTGGRLNFEFRHF
ncbi:hypothetical protein HY990_02445 [Candidatus Micrarchaeota archaeon]|nr:hypothetical protein [Candidatus Micrarchaeota archaeon]